MAEVLGVIVQVDCRDCLGKGWVPDQHERNCGNEGALKPCYSCEGSKVSTKAISISELRTLLEASG